jgi:hypothetical protein
VLDYTTVSASASSTLGRTRRQIEVWSEFFARHSCQVLDLDDPTVWHAVPTTDGIVVDAKLACEMRNPAQTFDGFL